MLRVGLYIKFKNIWVKIILKNKLKIMYEKSCFFLAKIDKAIERERERQSYVKSYNSLVIDKKKINIVKNRT